MGVIRISFGGGAFKCFFCSSGVALLLLLGGCSSDNSKTSDFTLNPVKLFSSSKKPTTLNGDVGEVRAIKVAIDQKDLKKAIVRYRLTTKIKTGREKIIGADLNGDGVGEALVFFEGDEWCISTGCRMVIFAKGQNGFRQMTEIKRVRLPVLAAPQSTNGWRDIIARTGNKSIGVRSVALKFSGGYPGNASVVKEILASVPEGSEILFSDKSIVVDAN